VKLRAVGLGAVAFSALLIAPASPAISYGAIIGLGGEELLSEADTIARVRVLDVADLPKPNRPVNEEDEFVNTRISRAEIVDPLKGAVAKATIRIEHHNGLLCPNVIYAANEEYLVFLRKVPGTDRYVTIGFYSGAYQIEKHFIEGFYLFEEKKPQQYKKANAVIADLRERLKQVAAPAGK
jgi:hypothetical protein